ncbi:MAG: BrnT family toxin [Bacteroidota bacterium]
MASSPRLLEARHSFLLGRTGDNRGLFVVFTIRRNRIRVISARDMSDKERKVFNEALQENP